MKSRKFSFIHVRSHRDVNRQSSDFLAWTAAGNNAADEAAKRANQLRSPEQTRLLKQARHEWHNQVTRLRNVTNLQQSVMLSQAGGSVKPASAPATGDCSVKFAACLFH